MKRNVNKLLSTLLALCLVLAALPGTARAETVIYAVEGGNLYFDMATGAITGCDEAVTKASIPNMINGVTITEIDECAFEGCSSLTSVNIPDSVTTIGMFAFSQCSNLTSITIPDSVTTIRVYAFSQCSNLTSITIPDSVTTIGENAFFACDSLTSITIPDSVTTIGAEAFSYCHSLPSINVSSGNSNYISVDGVLFNAGKTLLHTYPMGKSNKSYSIPNSVTIIGEYAFLGCSSLTSITIPDSVTTIREGAFGDCKNLTSITIPNSVTTIGEDAFSFCDSLTSITIPDSVTSIGELAFEFCSGLTSITFPDSVTSIGGGAFWVCDSLTDVYYGGSQADWAKINIGTSNEPLLSATIHYNNTASQQPSATPTNSVSVTVNGAAVQWPDAAPFIDEHGRTMVPLRAVADAIGLDVNWNANTREASFTNGGKTIIFPIGSNAARTSDGKTVTMNTAAVIVNGRTYAPIRYLAEFFGYQVGWDAPSRTVLITS